VSLTRISSADQEDASRCVCGARCTYRLTRGGHTKYRCAGCASNYCAPEWQAELLPWAQRWYDQVTDVYGHYRELRTRTGLSPVALATLPRFKDVAQLEERYQRELRRRTA
jgi:hypothetical protein